MIELSLTDVAEALGVNYSGPSLRVSRVGTDTRASAPESLFFALTGERFDGHDFVQQAVMNGAAAVVVSRPVDVAVPQLLVPDVRLALGQLGRYLRRRLNPKVVALTGSAGKTTVKEMIAAVLREAGPTLATEGNFNNEVGVPLTLLRLTPEHRYAVVEMGARFPGDIAYTAELAEADLALITNVGAAHLEGMGSEAGVAETKGDIYRKLPAGGHALINQDCPWADYWASRLPAGVHCLRFGEDAAAQVRAEGLVMNAEGEAEFELVTPEGRAALRLPLPGRHNVSNALAAAACGLALGLDAATIARGLSRCPVVGGRLARLTGVGGLRLIDDTYNANATSLKAALDLLTLAKGRRVLVLGDMAELGEHAPRYHREAGEAAKALGIDALYAYGPLAAEAAVGFGGRVGGGQSFETLDALVEQIKTEASPELTVLVKGSRSARMERVVQALTPASAGTTEH
ncbi:MAG: UDP-N-acetylmuramoyl-tripeptide--D-alanyl-D-alanine ligase [Gammaproteobacteria bacterium]|nr:UDP-N-acetylmuramoyl-tripeptide--D-alanyl-D-alanine ligase [Gammaproteobacteria bacterium]